MLAIVRWRDAPLLGGYWSLVDLMPREADHCVLEEWEGAVHGYVVQSEDIGEVMAELEQVTSKPVFLDGRLKLGSL